MWAKCRQAWNTECLFVFPATLYYIICIFRLWILLTHQPMHRRHFQFYNSARTSDSGFSDRWRHFLSKFSSFYFSMFDGDHRPQITIWFLDVGNTMLYWWSHQCSLSFSLMSRRQVTFWKSLVSDIVVFFCNFFGSTHFKFCFCFT